MYSIHLLVVESPTHVIKYHTGPGRQITFHVVGPSASALEERGDFLLHVVACQLATRTL